MTTDITELAPAMKAAAEKLDGAHWQTRKGFSGIEVIVKGSLEKRSGFTSFQPVAADLPDTKTARAIALFSPANVLALVEALFGVTTPDLPPLDAQPAQPCEHSMFWDASGVRRCSKCDIPEHANVHYADAAEMEIAALRLRIAELEKSELQLIDERDIAEEALSDMYQAATGERPEWSNMFGFADAVDAVEHRLGELESRTVTVKLPRHGFITISGKRTAVYLKADVDAALATAGIREDE